MERTPGHVEWRASLEKRNGDHVRKVIMAVALLAFLGSVVLVTSAGSSVAVLPPSPPPAKHHWDNYPDCRTWKCVKRVRGVREQRFRRCLKHSHLAVASYYGDSTGNTDNTLGPGSYAELSNNPSALDFSALGGLPNGTRIDVWRGGKPERMYKRDVGAGGGGLYHNGKYIKRKIDIHTSGGAVERLGLRGAGIAIVRYSFNRCF